MRIEGEAGGPVEFSLRGGRAIAVKALQAVSSKDGQDAAGVDFDDDVIIKIGDVQVTVRIGDDALDCGERGLESGTGRGGKDPAGAGDGFDVGLRG